MECPWANSLPLLIAQMQRTAVLSLPIGNALPEAAVIARLPAETEVAHRLVEETALVHHRERIKTAATGTHMAVVAPVVIGERKSLIFATRPPTKSIVLERAFHEKSARTTSTMPATVARLFQNKLFHAPALYS